MRKIRRAAMELKGRLDFFLHEREYKTQNFAKYFKLSNAY